MNTTAVTIDITIEAGDWAQTHAQAEDLVRRAIAAVCAAFDDLPPRAEVSVLLTDDAHQQVLNRNWRGKDKPTNVLSFPGDDMDPSDTGAPVLLGDISIALETTVREALEQEKNFADHFCHLVVHGMVHLLGFDHETQDQADEMEGLEIEVLEGLGVANPYLER